MVRILLSTATYQDTPGPHHDMLASIDAETHCERGPLTEAQLMNLAGEFDAFLCGDDAITGNVLEKFSPRLKIISKYGIGVDKIDVVRCTELGIPVAFCPGVNHTTVAEHAFLLLLAVCRHFIDQVNAVRVGNWKRLTGRDIRGKKLGVVGLGRIGKEVIKRAAAFDLQIAGFSPTWPEEFAAQYAVEKSSSLDSLLASCDIIMLHTSLNETTRHMIRQETIAGMKDGAIIVNCARGGLVNSLDIRAALESGKLGGYATDVLDEEPPARDHPLLAAPNCVITPHIGSRTFESVARQASMATENLLLCLRGQPPLAQVNEVAIPAALIS